MLMLLLINYVLIKTIILLWFYFVLFVGHLYLINYFIIDIHMCCHIFHPRLYGQQNYISVDV